VSKQRARKGENEEGFTLIELVAALAIAAFAFVALAMMLAGSLKGLAVSKTRQQANEIATQGIEDLQRYDFNDLGLCPDAVNDPSPAMPASLTNPTTPTLVTLPNCANGAVYTNPCTPPSGTQVSFAVPKQTYTCTRNNVAYTVNRYIVWTDGTHTGKRLAVFVTWKDQVGGHQVAQESSLRSPNAASVVGLLPPQFVNVSVSNVNVKILNDGTLNDTITFSATTSGLVSTDSVYVTLLTLTTQPDGTVAALPTQYGLASADGTSWTATVTPAGTPPLFGAGTQFVTFTAVRAADTKANSKFYGTPISFCPASCPGSLPTVAPTIAPSSINIDTSGVLLTPFTISATTTNLTTDATVIALVNTQTGAESIPLQPSNSCVVGGSCNSWSAIVAPGTTDLRFLPGIQQLYVTAIEPVGGSGGTNGASTVSSTGPVTFG
jgi:prepilin-type N-terminal cleavage/methylation domain-containing protein